jgi:limonene-1,2-epoxide hydrolase
VLLDEFQLPCPGLGMRGADRQRCRLTPVRYITQRDPSPDEERPDAGSPVPSLERLVDVGDVVRDLNEVLPFGRAEREGGDRLAPSIYIEIDASQPCGWLSSSAAMDLPPDPAALALVRAFCAAWDRLDLDAVCAMLVDDVVYHNIPMERLQGRSAVEAYLRQAAAFESARWELVAIAANGTTVLTERVDRFTSNGHDISLRVMGTFEVRGGRISAWRDYFDLADYRRQLAAADTA